MFFFCTDDKTLITFFGSRCLCQTEICLRWKLSVDCDGSQVVWIFFCLVLINQCKKKVLSQQKGNVWYSLNSIRKIQFILQRIHLKKIYILSEKIRIFRESVDELSVSFRHYSIYMERLRVHLSIHCVRILSGIFLLEEARVVHEISLYSYISSAKSFFVVFTP